MLYEVITLLAELLDYCQQSCCLPDGSREPKDLWRRLVRQEALVPYDPRYFDPAAPVSFAADWCPPADLAPAEPLIGTPLPLPTQLLAQLVAGQGIGGEGLVLLRLRHAGIEAHPQAALKEVGHRVLRKAQQIGQLQQAVGQQLPRQRQRLANKGLSRR